MYNHQLDTFIKVADSGSFNKASEELYVSPNAVMKQINLLENSLGFDLFVRTHRGVQLQLRENPCTGMQSILSSMPKIPSREPKRWWQSPSMC